MKRFTPNEKYTKSYKTVENLDKALVKLGYETLHHILYYFPSGRVTAVFVDEKANPVIFDGFCWCR